MRFYYTLTTLLLLGTLGLVGCHSKKEDAAETQPEELTTEEKQNLSLKQQEELSVSEDNVMNPFPG